MDLVLNFFVMVVASLHFYFMILEMFLWTKATGLKTFGQSLERAKATQMLAANQGLYNGFLAAGLVWSVVHPSEDVALQLKLFFLACVVLAGLYGAYSVSKKIFFIQALPALLALALMVAWH
jgi:putative membrane protein